MSFYIALPFNAAFLKSFRELQKDHNLLGTTISPLTFRTSAVMLAASRLEIRPKRQRVDEVVQQLWPGKPDNLAGVTLALLRPSLNRCLVSSAVAKPINITVTDAIRVSGLLQMPTRARACYVLAHGAGAGMDHPFMIAVATELARHGIATLRYQFPYMERGARRPDPPQRGGKSFGGRMTSQTQAKHRDLHPCPLVTQSGHWTTVQL